MGKNRSTPCPWHLETIEQVKISAMLWYWLGSANVTLRVLPCFFNQILLSTTVDAEFFIASRVKYASSIGEA
jgi:hypothetical protein